ncbi:MAG: hypothetical protein UR69_C0002G0205 [Candidatus Moranbacteria bacterium GW2011_GWE2_35_2-]|nr:MAG: hypothetical protein UR69_C0002G0205 [Candidatus Moranbacteria bacterium GW2011_GWE2_35_2-]KKQ03960.1 MAG: hypothetical protein US15_C0072G0006 [Candidatus Moranbacteria bacterium GW2011_GWF1_36_4]KKQ22446.1 MAG: hypothetical protein US37_C0002G0071 [Candidatus Moranbacteria bacterium GW2011_GWF2_37_11]KKQ29515.1 MAG: hypothetical protein US44_C0001G0107 [Candidatus Moranbacteria bacterium GW2011_GWD1_37_17]KKQ30615.1 MAG: hypothetical protein US47_C0002G0205 [Candidatus Moranbacteria b
MKIKLHKNWIPFVDTYRLTKDEIEFQVMQDIRKYKEIYQKKFNKAPSEKLDIDNYIEIMWGFQIVFHEIVPDTSDDEIWGYLDPENKIIYVNPNCSPERINFTVAHEAGHLSLHLSMMRLENGEVVGWQGKPLPSQSNKVVSDGREKRLEWQANKYASTLLVPKFDLVNYFSQLGLVENGGLKSVLNLDFVYPKIKERFGISKKAFQIRLEDLGFIGNRKKLL